jgi:hypothetical protein
MTQFPGFSRSTVLYSSQATEDLVSETNEFWRRTFERADATSEAVTLMLCNNQEQAFSLSADAGKVIQNIRGRYLKDPLMTRYT